MNNIEKVFDNYTKRYINSGSNLNNYMDKYTHSYFVRDEALIIDSNLTKYNDGFKKILEIESLFHDIGRFEQLRLTGTFIDNDLYNKYSILDHGDLGAIVMEQENLLKALYPFDRMFDKEILCAIKNHSKTNNNILYQIKREDLNMFRNYDLYDFFKSIKTERERKILNAVNTAIIMDADRLEIFRKIIQRIWIPICSNEEIKTEVWNLFKQDKLPSMKELRERGLWNCNVGHLVRMNFINQMCLVAELEKIKSENLIEKIYDICGNEIVRPAYEYTKNKIDEIIDKSEDKILVKKYIKN